MGRVTNGRRVEEARIHLQHQNQATFRPHHRREQFKEARLELDCCRVFWSRRRAMGAGGRNWELLKQKFRVTACAGVDNSRIQDAERERQEEEEAVGSDHKVQQALSWTSEHGLLLGETVAAESDVPLEAPEKVNWGGTVTKEELGRSTWTFLHTLAAQFPRKPTKQQQRDVKEMMGIISRLYPCKTCAEHFKDVLKTHPPKTNSGIELAEWMCHVHNIVNKSLGKPEFPCQQVDIRWGAFGCDGACDLHSRP